MTIEESIRARTRRPTTEERLHRALPDVPIDQLRRELDRLVGQGVLIRGKKGTLAPVESLGLRRAVFCATGHAYSFATPEEGGPDWFIPPGQAGGAWQGDTVLVRPLERPGHRQSARVVRVLERRTQRITGRLEVEKSGPISCRTMGATPAWRWSGRRWAAPPPAIKSPPRCSPSASGTSRPGAACCGATGRTGCASPACWPPWMRRRCATPSPARCRRRPRS